MERGDGAMSLNESLERYREHLLNAYAGNDADKAMILKVMVSIYPLLRQFGIYFTGPVALITDSYQQANQIMKNLSGFSPQKLTGTAVKGKELKKVLQGTEYELIPFWFYRAKESCSNIQYMEEFCKTGDAFGEMIGGPMVLVAFSGGIPLEIVDYFAGRVYLITKAKDEGGKNGCDEEFSKTLIDYVLENFSAIRREIESAAEEGEQGEPGILAFDAAERVCRMMIEDAGFPENVKDTYIENYIKAVGALVKEWTISAMEGDWTEQFLRVLYEAAECIPDILNREQLLEGDMEKLETLPMFDAEYYYLATTLFRNICEPLLGTVSIDFIKKTLADENIIIGEGVSRNYQTAKVQVVTEYNTTTRIRKIRLSRLKIDREGSLSWYEKIKLKEGCDEDEKDCCVGKGFGELLLSEGCSRCDE